MKWGGGQSSLFPSRLDTFEYQSRFFLVKPKSLKRPLRLPIFDEQLLAAIKNLRVDQTAVVM